MSDNFKEKTSESSVITNFQESFAAEQIYVICDKFGFKGHFSL